MPITATVDSQGVRIGLGELRDELTNPSVPLASVGTYMIASIARTFRDEGSPAGSWARLAASTLKKKGYTSGHKLLVLSGRLFRSFTSRVFGSSVVIGTNVPYAGVQNLGSADRRGAAIGPQAKIEGRGAEVEQHTRRRFGFATQKDASGRNRKVRVQVGESTVSAHTRYQNIPPRPFAVFRPEDPAAIVQIFENYVQGRAASLGMAGAR